MLTDPLALLSTLLLLVCQATLSSLSLANISTLHPCTGITGIFNRACCTTWQSNSYICSSSRLMCRCITSQCATTTASGLQFCISHAVMGAVRVLVTFNSSPTAIVPEESAPRFHPKNTSCFQDPMADHPRAFPDLQAAQGQWNSYNKAAQYMPSLTAHFRPCRGLYSSALLSK